MRGPGRTIIVGLDGMPYELMKRFARDGTMPRFGALSEKSVFRKMASSIPEVSSVAWSSVITGTNPGRHGVYGFTDVAPDTYRTTFPNYRNLKAKPFWEREESGRSVIINVPTTFPAREMNGVHIAGFVALDLERATYPPSLVPILEGLDYRVDVDSQKAHQSLGFFLRDLDKTLQARIAAYRRLWKEEDWDSFMLVFTGTDRLAHFLWNAYEDEGHEHHQAFLEHFRQIDEVIGEIATELTDDDRLLVLSDHGFERLKSDIYVNYLLREEGFLSFQEGAKPGLRAVSADAKAFALDPGRIYLHTKRRYPRGGVAPADEEPLLTDLLQLFNSLEKDGERVIRHTYRAEELYDGPQAARAPDLVLLGNTGYNLRGNWKAGSVFGTDIFVGKHSQADAFLLVHGQGAQAVVPQRPSVTDVVSIIDTMGRT